MLVVVYLMDAKQNIIIPQEWIMSLNQEILNNVGKASYQNRRIFWSSRGLNENEIPDESNVPNFRLPLSFVFPPENEETCYIARVKRYCANSNSALIFRDKFRAQAPIRYVARRRSDMSTPPTSPTQSEQRNEVSSNSVDSNSIGQQDEADIVGSSLDENSVDIPNYEFENDDDQMNEHVATLIETTFLEEGVLKIRTVFDDDLEMVCASGASVAPYVGFDCKANDPISKSIPYKEYANGARAYLIVSKQRADEVFLTAMTVNGLKQLNSTGKRENNNFDMHFVKVLLLGFIGTKIIKSKGVDTNVLKLIKELFQIRVGTKNEERLATFDDLVKKATTEIQK